VKTLINCGWSLGISVMLICELKLSCFSW